MVKKEGRRMKAEVGAMKFEEQSVAD